MPSSEYDLCIKCNKGGNLLVCNSDDCPIVVHEQCMGCPARSDVIGKFYCPYCLYRNAYAELNQAREDAVLKKKSLSSFIDAKMIDDCSKQKEVSGNAEKERKSPLGETQNSEQETGIHNYKTSIHQLDEVIEEGAPECRIVSLCRGHDGSLLHDQNVVSSHSQGNTSKAIYSAHNLPVSGQSNIATGVDNLGREEESGQLFEVDNISRTVEDQVCRKVDHMVHKEVEDKQENKNLSASPSVQEKPSERETEDLKSVEENESRNNCDKTAYPNETNSISDIQLGGETSNELSVEHSLVLRKCVKVASPCEPPSSNVECADRSSPIMRESPRNTEKTINSPCEPTMGKGYVPVEAVENDYDSDVEIVKVVNDPTVDPTEIQRSQRRAKRYLTKQLNRQSEKKLKL